VALHEKTALRAEKQDERMGPAFFAMKYRLSSRPNKKEKK
jgi:hypothetical protein